MNEKKAIKNAAWIIFSKIVQAILTLIVSILTARYLGPSNFGLINYANSIVLFMIPIMSLGFTGIIVQELLNNPSKEGEILGTAILGSLIASFFCVIASLSFVLLINYNEIDTFIVTLIMSLLIIFKVFDVINYWYQSKLISKYTSIIAIFAYIVSAIFKIALLITRKNIYWFSFAQISDVFLIVIFSLVLYKKLGGEKFKFSLEIFKKMFSKSKYYILSGLMVSIFANTDRVMLKIMINDEATGLYSASVACAGMTTFIFSAIIDSMRPIILECKKCSNKEFNTNMMRLYSIVIYFALFQSLIISLFSKLVIYVLYGPEYFGAVNSLRIIVWYTTFSYIGAVRNVWILANNKQKSIIKIDLTGAVFNIVLNMILIPMYGINGAAIASLLTQIFSNVVMVAIIKDVKENIGLMIKSLNPAIFLDSLKIIFKK